VSQSQRRHRPRPTPRGCAGRAAQAGAIAPISDDPRGHAGHFGLFRRGARPTDRLRERRDRAGRQQSAESDGPLWQVRPEWSVPQARPRQLLHEASRPHRPSQLVGNDGPWAIPARATSSARWGRLGRGEDVVAGQAAAAGRVIGRVGPAAAGPSIGRKPARFTMPSHARRFLKGAAPPAAGATSEATQARAVLRQSDDPRSNATAVVLVP
jgi:hypothetical protein